MSNNILNSVDVGMSADEVIKILGPHGIQRVKSEEVGKDENGLIVNWYLRQGESGSDIGAKILFKRSQIVPSIYRVVSVEEWDPEKGIKNVNK